MTLASVLQRIAERLTCRNIVGHDGSTYLARYTVFNFGRDGWRLYLHRFDRGDEDPELHNHPWRAVSVILSGGYREERRFDAIDSFGNDTHGIMEIERRPGSINFIDYDTFHRVDLLGGPAWSLILCGPTARSWGFWNRLTGVFTPWREFIRAKGLTPYEHTEKP